MMVSMKEKEADNSGFQSVVALECYRTKPLTEIIQINSFLQSQTQRNNNATVIEFRARVSGLAWAAESVWICLTGDETGQ